MTKHGKWIVGGVAVLAVSIFVGVIGTVGGIYNSFDALKTNESTGIGAVGGGLWIALLSTIVSLIGTLIGIILIVMGIVKSRRSA